MFENLERQAQEKELEEKLELLRAAVATGDDAEAKRALKLAVPTFKSPEEINAEAAKAKEMLEAKEAVPV